MSSKDYVHLHVHTDFSMLDGLAKFEGYIDRAVRLGQPALAITDHGVLCGLPSFYHYARKASVEPILGSEMYFVPDYANKPTMTTKDSSDKMRHHITILAKGRIGYEVLAELSTASYGQFYHKPLLDRALLEQLGKDAKHLVVLSGCVSSLLSQKVLANDEGQIEELQWWRQTFPNFYIEVMDHECDFDQQLNNGLLKLANKYNVPWVVTNDPHYVVSKDQEYHDALLAIQTASDINDPNRFRFQGTGYHLRSAYEMRKAFKKYPSEVWEVGRANSVEIAEMCHTRVKEWESRTWHIPNFPDTNTPFEELRRLARQGLKRRHLDDKPEYVSRMKEELDAIRKVGISDFLLITRDCIKWAQDQGIPVGPGRGSVAGCLVGYLIDIHKVDSIRYDLMFERFLNPARPRMPDIDTDFGQTRRAEMFEYVSEKYGRNNVVLVCVYAKMKNKSAFQSLAAAHGISFPERVRISKQLPDTGEDEEDYLPQEIKDKYPELATKLQKLSGTRRSIGAHPAGVIIADPKINVRKMVPELFIPNPKPGRWVGQYDLDAIEEMGLMKQDFLGLRTLDTIDVCVRFIFNRTGEAINPDTWVPDEEPDDDKVYDTLTKGDTVGVFQMEGGANTRGIQDVQCTCFEDIVSTTSLYRTGPIMAGYPKQFLNNRNVGIKKIKYEHPLLKPILDRTWGVILYQEQVMEIGAVLAGFDIVQIDDIKEAIKHKKSALMESMRPVFIRGCHKTNKIPESISTTIWKDIEGYSGYSYNRSHAVAYSFLSYQTARLKYLYPLEFHAALVHTMDPSNKIKREAYLQAVIKAGFKLLPPDINQSEARAVPDVSGEAIRFGLADLAGIGPKLAERLVLARPDEGYGSVAQVREAVRNERAMEVLELSSTLEPVGVSGDEVKTEELLNWQFTDPMERWRKRYKGQFRLPKGDGDCKVLGMITKTTKAKTKTGKDYTTWTIKHSPLQSYMVRLWSSTEELWPLGVGSIVIVSGRYEEKWGNLSIASPERVKVIKRMKHA